MGRKGYTLINLQERLLTGRGLSWGHVTEGKGEKEPPQVLTVRMGTAPANMNGRDKGNQAFPNKRYFYV